MSGLAIVTELLLVGPAMADVAGRGALKEDRLPDNVTLPAVLLREISSVDRPTLKRGALIRTTERIAVTVRAGSVRERKALLRTIRDLCHGRTGDLAGCQRVSVRTDGRGPSLLGPAASFEQTQDFRVSFDAPA